MAEYSAGTIFLDVVPSFHNVQRRAQKAGAEMGAAAARGAKPGLEKLEHSMAEAGEDGGQKAGDAFGRALTKRVRAAQAAIGSVKIGADLDSKRLAAQIGSAKAALKTIEKMTIEPEIEGAEVLAKAKLLDRQLEAILRDQTIDIRARTNLGAVRQELGEMTRQIHAFGGATRSELAQAEQAHKQFTERAKAEQRALTRALKAHYDTDKTMAAAAEEFKSRQHQTFLRQYVQREQDAARQVERARSLVRLRALQQQEAENRLGRTGASEDYVAAQAAIRARYEAEAQAAQAAARQRQAAAARAAFAETSSHAAAKRAGKEHYDDVSDAAARSAAQRIALARLAAQQERALASRTQTGFFAVAAAAAGQAANSMRLFNGYLLAAVLLGPLLIPVLAGIAGGLGAIAVMASAAIAGLGALLFGFAGIGGAVTALSNLDKERRKQSVGSGASAERDFRALRNAQEGLARAREDAGRRIAAAARTQENAERALTRAVEDAADANRDLLRARREAAEDLEDLNARLAAGLLDERLGAFSLQEAGFRFHNILEDDQATAREKEIARLEYQRAQQQYADLQRSNRRLEREVAEANEKGVEGSDKVVQAKERIVDSNERVADAERALREAQEGVARARVEEARAMADAERRVADAMVDLQAKSVEAGVAGSAAMDALRESMEGLSPAGRDFALFLYSLKPLLDDIRAAAQMGLLPGVQEMISTLATEYGSGFVDFIGSISTVLGELAVAMAEMFTTPWWREFFAQVAEFAPGFVRQLGEMFLLLLRIGAGILIAFAPFAERFGEALIAILETAAEWAEGLDESVGFAKFLAFIEESGPKVLEIIGLLFEIFLKLSEGLMPHIDRLLDVLIGGLEWLASQDPQTLATWALALGAFVTAFQILAGLTAFLSGFTIMIQGVVAAIGAIAAAAGISSLALIGWIAGIVAVVAAIVVGLIWLSQWAAQSEEVAAFNQEVAAIISAAWEAVGAIFREVWEVWIKPVWDIFVGTLMKFVLPAWNMLRDQIAKGWAFISAIFSVAWQVVSTIWNMIAQVFTHIVGPAFAALYDKFIRPIWEDKILPIFRAIAAWIDENIVPVWESAIETLGRIFDRIREAAAKPIRWVIETVINDGLIGGFNKLAGMVPGMTPIDRIAIPAALQEPRRGGGGSFASGGVLPGYTPGRDVHTFYSPSAGTLHLSGGEGILIPEVVRMLGPAWVYGINAAVRAGRSPRPFLGGFADGGVIGDFADAMRGAVGKATDVISDVTSNIRAVLTDPAAGLRGIVDGLFRLVPGGDTPLMQAGKAIPYKLADGLASVITRAQEATPATGGDPSIAARPGHSWPWMVAAVREAFPWVRITSTYRPGAITATGIPSMHGKGRAVDMSPSMSIFNWILSNYPDSAQILYSPAGARQIVWNGRRGDTSGITRAMHYNHVHWAYKHGGVVPKLYDNGGYLPPGLSVVANKTGKPEPILTDAQWQAVAKGGLGGGRTTQINIDQVVGDREHAERVADIVEARQRDAAVMSDLSAIGVSL